MRVDLLRSAQHLERVNICVQVSNIAKQKLAVLSSELIEHDGKGVDDDDDDDGEENRRSGRLTRCTVC